MFGNVDGSFPIVKFKFMPQLCEMQASTLHISFKSMTLDRHSKMSATQDGPLVTPICGRMLSLLKCSLAFVHLAACDGSNASPYSSA